MYERVNLDKQEGDIACFYALNLFAEYITKLVTAGVVALLLDDPDRHRYSLEHKLVRANSIGEWVEALNLALTGPAAQFFDVKARGVVQELTQRVEGGDWRYEVVNKIYIAAKNLNIQTDRVGAKVSLRQFFQINATIRNKTRGHGAPTITQCTSAIPLLEQAINQLLENIQIFQLPWAHLHRNLSGKYRVTSLLRDCNPLDYLKRTREESFPNGVYLYLDRPIRVPLVFTEAGASDIFVLNGQFKNKTFEVLSYITNASKREDGTVWLTPPDRLPPSETEGKSSLEIFENVFANLPPRARGYVSRPKLEKRLIEELIVTDRHPIVSLTGPGGIGKTTLAIAAIEQLARRESPPYEVILWLSARDIDLLESGPKPVSPRVVTKEDMAKAAVDLLEPKGRFDQSFDPVRFFQDCLRTGTAGPTLFVIDNFETVESPADVFQWIDTHIRLPNKVLITTRFRDFAGDYPIKVKGMSDEEAYRLIDQEAKRLKISDIIDREYVEELIRESEGHPYVIKILLGQVAKERRKVTPERIVASSDHLLNALFERTYTSLTPAAQRTFLLLCSWRVLIPEIAVEAVSLRPGNERFDVRNALDDLRRYSLIEEVVSKQDEEVFVGVPLAAAMYGRRKLEISPFKIAIEEDRRLLLEFGAGKREDAHHGVAPRINRFIKSVARTISEGRRTLEDTLPILEYLASRVPRVYVQLADLVLEIGSEHVERAKGYLRTYLETAPTYKKEEIWFKIADLCQLTNDTMGEVHALSEAALLPTARTRDVSEIANRINSRIRMLKGQKVEEAWSEEVCLLLARVASAMEKHFDKLSATDCSRLAWLYLNIGNKERARDIAQKGLSRDPNDWHCQNLVEKLCV